MRRIVMMAAASSLLLAAPALAVQYQFVVVDPTVRQNGAPLDNNSYTFFLDSSPAPTIFTDVTFSLEGSVSYTAGVFGSYNVFSNFDFSTADAGGGLNTILGLYFGDQLFTGPTSAPTFSLGTFQIDAGTVTISEVGAATGPVPEPAAWSMMIAGFGLVGAALRSRRTTVRFAK